MFQDLLAGPARHSSRPSPGPDDDPHDRGHRRPWHRRDHRHLQRHSRRPAAAAADTPTPAGLVRIYTDAPPNRFRFSVADYLALQAEQTHFEQVAGYTDRLMSFSDGNVAERLRGKLVSWTYFSLLGLRPAIGRDFAEADGRPGNPLAVIVVARVLASAPWLGRLDAIGKPIRIDGADHIVVGVLPSDGRPAREQGAGLFIAAQWQPPRRKGPFFITTLARLRSESERSAAADELRAINRRMFPIWRSSHQDDKATWSFIDFEAASSPATSS